MKKTSIARYLYVLTTCVLTTSQLALPQQVPTVGSVLRPKVLETRPSSAPAVNPRQEFVIQRTTSPIRVDGVLNETTWESATRILLPFETNPGNNTPARVPTECRVTFDDSHFYFAFVASDPEPGNIRAFITDRDKVEGHDRVSLIIDPFNDTRRAFNFTVTALGVQLDGIHDQQQGFDDSWDAIWDSAGRITAEGYLVEAAIPFKSLRFPNVDSLQTWGVYAERWWPRDERVQTMSMRWDRNNSCQLCQANLLTGFSDISPGQNIEVTPTFTSSRVDARDDFPSGVLETGNVRGDFGLNASWGITTNLNLNGTMNPDFSQVEADVAQLDMNNRFALFFPEKRSFFLEGADFFRTPLFAVFTRSIADPSMGIKVTGKIGSNAVGAIVAQDEINNLIFPGYQSSSSTTIEDQVTAGVARFRRDVGKSSNIGLLMTLRQGSSYHNRVGGMDGFWRPFGPVTVQFQYLRSGTRYPSAVAIENEQRAGGFSGNAARLHMKYDTRDWLVQVESRTIDPGFRADAGFVTQVDVREFWGSVTRRIWGRPGSWFSQIDIHVGGRRTDSFDGSRTAKAVWADINYEGPLQSLLNFHPYKTREDFNGRVFNTAGFWTNFGLRPSGNWSFDLGFCLGDRIDVRNTQNAYEIWVGPSTQVRLGRHIDFKLSHTFQRLSKEEEEIFAANLSELRGVYNFSPRSFIRAIVQFQNTRRNPDLHVSEVNRESKSAFFQLLFSYKVNPQTVFFLGYSDNREGALDTAFQRVPLTQLDRTFFLKLGYAWRP